MKDKICNQDLLQLYNELTEKWYRYYSEQPVLKFVKLAQKVIVSGLVLYCCVRLAWFPLLFIDPYKGVIKYRDKELEIRDTALLFIIRHWYLEPQRFQSEWSPRRDYSYLHKVSERQARRIVKEVLGVEPKTARLACAAHIACTEDVETAAKYYDTARWYLRRLLAEKPDNPNFKQIVIARYMGVGVR